MPSRGVWYLLLPLPKPTTRACRARLSSISIILGRCFRVPLKHVPWHCHGHEPGLGLGM